MTKKTRKVELIEEECDMSMEGGLYKQDYRGNIVKDGSNHNYFHRDGKSVCWLPEELVDLIILGEHVTNEVISVDDLPKPETRGSSGVVSLVDMIGDTPKKLNIEF